GRAASCAPRQSSVWSGRSSAKLLFVEPRIGGFGIIEDGAAGREAAPFIEAIGFGKAGRLTGLEDQARHALFGRERFDLRQQSRPDALPAHLGQRVHALDLAQAAAMSLEAGHADRATALVAGDVERNG